MIDTLLSEKILILDGAIGTMIQPLGLTESDFRGNRFADHPVDLRGNNDLLTLTQPAAILDIYEQYLKAGADIITANTFNSNRLSQSDYQLEHLVSELNREAAAMAKKKAMQYSTAAKPRFVAGTLGPTGKTASMSPDVNNPAYRAVTFDDLVEAYIEQADALIDGGADIINLQDLVNGIDYISKRFAGKSCVELDIDRQNITVFGTPKDIDNHIREAIKAIGRKEGGFMMIYGWYPGTPIENAAAIMDAMEKYRSYFND